MQGQATYRKILATCFLLLYVFIYMPVQLWHHHSAVQEKSVSGKLAKAVIDSKSEECKICQHTYTAYINDYSHFNIAEVNAVFCNESFLCAHFPFPFIDKASNKGPPSI